MTSVQPAGEQPGHLVHRQNQLSIYARHVVPTLRSGLLLSEAQLPNKGAGSGGGAASEGGVTGKLKGSAGRPTHDHIQPSAIVCKELAWHSRPTQAGCSPPAGAHLSNRCSKRHLACASSCPGATGTPRRFHDRPLQVPINQATSWVHASKLSCQHAPASMQARLRHAPVPAHLWCLLPWTRCTAVPVHCHVCRPPPVAQGAGETGAALHRSQPQPGPPVNHPHGLPQHPARLLQLVLLAGGQVSSPFGGRQLLRQ